MIINESFDEYHEIFLVINKDNEYFTKLFTDVLLKIIFKKALFEFLLNFKQK